MIASAILTLAAIALWLPSKVSRARRNRARRLEVRERLVVALAPDYELRESRYHGSDAWGR